MGGRWAPRKSTEVSCAQADLPGFGTLVRDEFKGVGRRVAGRNPGAAVDPSVVRRGAILRLAAVMDSVSLQYL